MNEYDISYNAQRFARHSVKARACRIIKRLMHLTNQVSDGWSYWSKPARSAARLMALVDQENPTEADLNKALSPIKAMLTRNAKVFTSQPPLDFE